MQVVRILVVMACVLAGLVIGALNHQPVTLDLGGATVVTTTGIALLVALLIGALLGGTALLLSVVVPMRRKLGKLQAIRTGQTRTDAPT